MGEFLEKLITLHFCEGRYYEGLCTLARRRLIGILDQVLQDLLSVLARLNVILNAVPLSERGWPLLASFCFLSVQFLSVEELGSLHEVACRSLITNLGFRRARETVRNQKNVTQQNLKLTYIGKRRSVFRCLGCRDLGDFDSWLESMVALCYVQ